MYWSIGPLVSFSGNYRVTLAVRVPPCSRFRVPPTYSLFSAFECKLGYAGFLFSSSQCRVFHFRFSHQYAAAAFFLYCSLRVELCEKRCFWKWGSQYGLIVQCGIIYSNIFLDRFVHFYKNVLKSDQTFYNFLYVQKILT